MKYRLITLLKLLFIIQIMIFVAGCADNKRVFNEVKHPNEKLKVSEVNQFLEIVKSLPGHKLPALPPLYSPVPNWESTRELSIKGLIKEEKKDLPNRWFSETVLAKLSSNRRLNKVLEEQNLSLEQFLGLTETIAIAASRAQFENKDELRVIQRTGRLEVAKLSRLEEVFSGFPEEEQYEIVRSAAWLSRMNRAEYLLKVPDENVELLRTHWAAITPFLPEDATKDPMADIVDSLLMFGLPFEELPESGSDISLKWSAEEEGVLFGYDKLSPKRPVQ